MSNLKPLNSDIRICGFFYFWLDFILKKGPNLNSDTPQYNAQISAGSLLLKESSEIAKLLLEQVDEAGWHKALVINNVLQKKTPSTALRMASLIRNRLEMMDSAHWQLVLDDDREVVIQSLLVGAIKHSRLLEDFLCDVVREHYRTFNHQISSGDWRNFLIECEHLSEIVAGWSGSTKKKLGQVVFRILAESGYLNSDHKMQLSAIQIHPKVRDYLQTHDMKNILHCMEIDR